MALEKPKSVFPDEGIEGFKKSNFVDAKTVLGQDVRIESLPDGIRFYLKGQAVNLAEKRIVVNLYELFREPDGLKLRKEHLEKYLNRIPEDEEIALNYGPSDEGYIWIAKWRDIAGDEMGIMSEAVRVSEKWRVRYEEHQLKKTKAPAMAQAPALALAPAPASNWGPMEVLKIMQEGEDRAFRNMEKMAGIFAGTRQEMPASVLEKAYESAGKIMERALDSNMAMGKKVNALLADNLNPAPASDDDDDDLDPESENQVSQVNGPLDSMPAWMKPFLPVVEQWIGTLLGGGVAGQAVKTLIVSSDQYKAIFQDKEKFSVAVEAMQEHFGPEKANRAIEILMGKKSAKKAGK